MVEDGMRSCELDTVAMGDVALAAAYRAAILLTGSERLAERAVVRAIESMDIDAATSEELLRLTVIASMKSWLQRNSLRSVPAASRFSLLNFRTSCNYRIGFANLLCCVYC